MDAYSSLHDIITNGENGMIVPDGDIKAFSKALSILMTDDDKREKMAEAGMNSCKQYQVSQIVDKWEKIFNCL